MERIRAFIAVDVSPEVQARAKRLIQLLAPVAPEVKWVDPQQLHLTLSFLGDVEMLDVPELCETIAESVAPLPPFDLIVAGVGAFPAIDRPRTIWLGIETGIDELRALQARLQSDLERLGYRGENRQFQPHLTLGRVKGTGENSALTDLLFTHRDYLGGASDVSQAALFSSVLERRGPRYQLLFDAPLGGR